MAKDFSVQVATEFVNTSEGKIRLLVRRVSPLVPWIVLWPGQGDPAESLYVLLELAGESHLNIAVFDPPGHGLSDEPQTDYSQRSQQIVWESVLEHLEIERAYIGGYSYGAYSAAMCGGALAERVRGLILIEGGYLTMEQKNVTWQAETELIIEDRRAYRFDSWDEALEVIKSRVSTWTDHDEAEFYAAMVQRDGVVQQRMTEATIMYMEQALDRYSTAVFTGLTCPILLLHSILPPEKTEMRARGLVLFHEHAPHARTVPIPNCGHVIGDHLPFVMDRMVEFIRSTQE
jgi:pimeloyl-ACP methyl ester carboxylesterase